MLYWPLLSWNVWYSGRARASQGSFCWETGMATDDRRMTTDDRRTIEPVAVAGGLRGDFRAGFVATLPLWLGAAPFGAIYAVSALAAGLNWAQTLAMSLFVFAGASQFTAVG